jgi:hypothetical protein
VSLEAGDIRKSLQESFFAFPAEGVGRASRLYRTSILAYDAILYGLARRDPTVQTSPPARSACSSGSEGITSPSLRGFVLIST